MLDKLQPKCCGISVYYKVHPSTVNKFFCDRLEGKAVLCFLCVYQMVLSW